MIEAAGGYAGTYYYHYDALGSVVALSDANGDTVQVYEYDVYGQVAASDPNHPNRFMFTGREFDAETGLYYYRARYYNPTIGRFLQTDPIGYADGMNWYAYCGNNGVGRVDPSGRSSHDPYNLPKNEGPPISVAVAFYDGGDPGFDRDGDGVSDISNGAQFKESADDFVCVKDGLTYNLYFDMNVDNPSEFIATTLTSIAQRGYNVTDVYFFDHSVSDRNGNLVGLEFGDEVWDRSMLQAVAKWINFRYPNALPANCTLNFRQCYVASDQSFLEDLATWFNRDVTGVAGAILDLGPLEYDPDADEIPGPDYSFQGDLWKAKPGQTSEIIWEYRVPGPTDWLQPWKDPVEVLNPEPHGY